MEVRQGMLQEKSKKNLSIAALLLVAILWGLGYSAVQDALDGGWSSLGIMVAKGVVGGGICLLLSFKEKWWREPKLIKGALISGLFTFLGYYAQTEGQLRTSIPNCAFFTAINVILVPFIAAIFFKSKLDKKFIIAAFIALLGIGLLNYDGSTIKLGIGDLLNFAGALCFAVQIAYIAQLSKYDKPFGLAGMQLMVMGILALIMVPFFPNQTHFGSDGWIGIIYVTLISACLAYIIQGIAEKHVNETVSGVLLAQESTFGTMFSIIFYNSPITWQLLTGGGIVLFAVLLCCVNFKSIHQKIRYKKAKKEQEKRSLEIEKINNDEKNESDKIITEKNNESK